MSNTAPLTWFDVKDPTESVPLTFDFGPALPKGIVLTGFPTVTVLTEMGVDPNPTGLLVGGAGFDSTTTKIIQFVTGGFLNCIYQFVVTCATTEPGLVLTIVAYLPVWRR